MLVCDTATFELRQATWLDMDRAYRPTPNLVILQMREIIALRQTPMVKGDRTMQQRPKPSRKTSH